MGSFDPRLILLAPADNCVAVAASIHAGERLLFDGEVVEVRAAVSIGHKLARRDIRGGEKVFKYGAVIGSATRSIMRGEHVHLHNLASDYIATYVLPAS